MSNNGRHLRNPSGRHLREPFELVEPTGRLSSDEVAAVETPSPVGRVAQRIETTEETPSPVDRTGRLSSDDVKPTGRLSSEQSERPSKPPVDAADGGFDSRGCATAQPTIAETSNPTPVASEKPKAPLRDRLIVRSTIVAAAFALIGLFTGHSLASWNDLAIANEIKGATGHLDLEMVGEPQWMFYDFDWRPEPNETDPYPFTYDAPVTLINDDTDLTHFFFNYSSYPSLESTPCFVPPASTQACRKWRLNEIVMVSKWKASLNGNNIATKLTAPGVTEVMSAIDDSGLGAIVRNSSNESGLNVLFVDGSAEIDGKLIDEIGPYALGDSVLITPDNDGEEYWMIVQLFIQFPEESTGFNVVDFAPAGINQMLHEQYEGKTLTVGNIAPKLEQVRS